jgi:glycosyltransferase involved in cell wall biosynthesis
VINALVNFYNLSEEERKNMGRMGREHVEKNYNFEEFEKRWVDLMLDLHKNCGSWGSRKNYQSWKLTEIA